MACKPRDPGWYRTNPDALQEEYEAHGTMGAVAQAHGGDPSTYTHWWRRHKLPALPKGQKPATVTPDTLDVEVASQDDIARTLRDRGLNPDEWVVIRCVVNEWGDVDGPSKQLKITLRPRLDFLLRPAKTEKIDKPTPSKPKRLELGSKPRLVVFVGDEQAPYQDTTLHTLFCRWLAHNKPAEAIHLGDLMDFPTLSRHRPNPVWNASPQECIQAGYEILRGYQSSSPGTSWAALPGNHDERIRDYQLQRAPELFGVRQADLDERELAATVHSLPSLLHFDRLGVAWHGGDADYEHAQVDVSSELVARHGWITGANSAERAVKRLGLSLVVGHTHRQVVTYITEERRRESLTMLGIEAGCMCRIEGGLGYTVNPSWQNGFFAANVWPDGSFSGEHGTFRDGVLRWRDQRYAL